MPLKIRLRLALDKLLGLSNFHETDDQITQSERNDELVDVLAALEYAVHQHPSQRVGQVIENAVRHDTLFYLSDLHLEQLLNAYGRSDEV